MKNKQNIIYNNNISINVFLDNYCSNAQPIQDFINNISFKVLKNIERCSAINLRPNTDKITINLPLSLKKLYNHIDMGVYLEALEDGEINIGDNITIN